jgi:hypothetical protein
VCVVPGAAGASCDPSAPCAAGLTCSTGACLAPERAEGEPCQGDGSEATTTCQAGLGCVDGACRARLPAGSGCAGDASCVEELGCNDVAPPVCTAWRSLAEGAACSWDSFCATGLACVRGACRRRGDAHECDECGQEEDCAEGLHCVFGPVEGTTWTECDKG